MRYIPATEDDIRKMLEEVGVRNFDELFSMIPAELKFRGNLAVPDALSEQELTEHLWELSAKNDHLLGADSFLGGGSYHHYSPALVDALISRGEFMTSYTPYQPEISQGTLQAIFEFQTYMCQITGLDIANASMYDGASSAAEAVLMARRAQSGRNKVLVASTVHPTYRQVIRTYTANLPVEIVEIPYDEKGQVDLTHLQNQLDENTICVVVQSPNYFGMIEPQAELFQAAKQKGALGVSVITEALSLGILKSPGECGADLAAGEAQSLGLPVGYGGPYVGFLAARQNLMRMLPGRLVGMAKDQQGRRGFVLTLAAREQHIRREKATSNICTNQGLCALAVTVYMSFLGAEGFRNLALRNLQMAHYARKKLESAGRISFSGHHFNEFVLELSSDAERICNKLAAKKIYPGIPLGRYYPELKKHLVICVTEMTKRKQIDRLAEIIKDIQ
jgi:glycine dehydrogenase subunit 1